MTPRRFVFCALFLSALVSASTAYAQDDESPHDAAPVHPSRDGGPVCGPINADLIVFLLESDAIGCAPSAEFKKTQTEEGGPVAYFDASGSSDPDGQIVSWNWDFGDGTLGSGQRIGHTFAEPGNYEVHLTVTDNVGNQSQYSTTERVAVVADVGVSCTASGTVITRLES